MVLIPLQGGKIITGGKVLNNMPGFYVEPTIVLIRPDAPVVQHETFAPILYVSKISVSVVLNGSPCDYFENSH